jgi:hypothetical protein
MAALATLPGLTSPFVVAGAHVAVAINSGGIPPSLMTAPHPDRATILGGAIAPSKRTALTGKRRQKRRRDIAA